MDGSNSKFRRDRRVLVERRRRQDRRPRLYRLLHDFLLVAGYFRRAVGRLEGFVTESGKRQKHITSV